MTVRHRAVTWTSWLLIILGFVAIALSIAGLFNSGVAWDSPIDVRAAQEVQSLSPGLTKQAAYESVYSTSEFYGILVFQIAEGLRTVVTGQSGTLPVEDLATYRWLGLVNIGFATLGAACIGMAVGTVLSSRLAGSFAWSLTLSTPLLLGMSFIDIKDMPVAVGLSIVSAGLALSVAAPSARKRWSLGLLLVSLGAVIAMATRPGIWTGLVILAAGSLTAFTILAGSTRRWGLLAPPAVSLLVGGAVTALILWLSNPIARIDLVRWLYDAFSVMRGFTWPGSIRANGEDLLATELPWWYVPSWLIAQAPILTLAFAPVAITILGMATLSSRPWLPRPQLIAMAPFAVQGVALPLVIIVTGSAIYDGIRHLLFMVPALIALLAVGIAALDHMRLGNGGEGWYRRLGQVAAPIVALAIITSSLWAAARWWPYSYAYLNPVAGWDAERTLWDLDYWGVTAVEGVERLRAEGLSTIAVEPAQITSTMVGSVSQNQAERTAEGPYGLYVFNRFDASLGGCEELFTIQRDRQILGEGGICH